MNSSGLGVYVRISFFSMENRMLFFFRGPLCDLDPGLLPSPNLMGDALFSVSSVSVERIDLVGDMSMLNFTSRFCWGGFRFS